MSLDQMTLVYGALGILGAALVYLLVRLDRYATTRELTLANDRIDHLHESIHSLRNQIQGWMNEKRAGR